jgi:hypothetical protein
MIEGFVGGFAVGFISTSLPKLLSAPPFRPWQIFTLLGLHTSYSLSHLAGFVRVGDALFATMMVMLLVMLVLQIILRKTVPPPAMILAAMGIFSGTLGAAWMATAGFTGNILGYAFAQRLLYQAFILLPLLGIGAYIFPMILGTTHYQTKINENKITTAWKIKAAESGLLGTLIILSYWIEVQAGTPDQAKSMSWVRLALCFVWLTKESGWLRHNTAKGTMSFGLKAGIVCVLGSMLTTGIFQQHRIALDHSLYAGGFALITMMVAARVLYAHSGQEEKFRLWIKPLTITSGLILFTMLTRVTADFFPRVVISHHIYAALLWVIVSFIWGIALLPSVKKYPAPPVLTPKRKSTSLMDMTFRK